MVAQQVVLRCHQPLPSHPSSLDPVPPQHQQAWVQHQRQLPPHPCELLPTLLRWLGSIPQAQHSRCGVSPRLKSLGIHPRRVRWFEAPHP
jgi:hypothetical protein